MTEDNQDIEKATSDRLSDAEIEALKARADEFKRAQKQLTDALAIMWGTHLDTAISSGRADRIKDALAQPPVALWDDCNCNQKECGTEASK